GNEMAANLKLSNAAVNAACDAVVDLLDSGKIEIYTASQPAGPDTGITDQTLLAELTFGATAFGASSEGVATAEAITKDSAANATGEAAWFRVLTSEDGEMFDGSVGTEGCDLNLNSVAIQEGAEVSISSFIFTIPKAAA
ncbi:unnamed protein product, partial [marine sediment metagenome]